MKTRTTIIFAMLILLGMGKVNATDPDKGKVFHRVLLFKWQDNTSEESKQEILDLFLGLPEKVEGMNSCDACLLSKSQEGFETVVILSFSNEEAVKMYEEHPDHKKVQELGPTLVSGFSYYEYWK